MSKLSIERPAVKLSDVNEWIAYIIENGSKTGVAGHGDTPESAIKDAQDKIDKGKGEWKSLT